jgi:hypothetical protein
VPLDALDPGPDGDFPNWPRRPDGTPDPERMPTGMHLQKGVLIDVTPRHPDGTPIVPPTLPPEEG